MQTLWARVGQSRCFCKCSFHPFSTAAIARPSIGAPIRRRLDLDDVFAAFFSTVAFASAVADGKKKTARKEQLVRVIEEAKSDLQTLKADRERRISTLEQAGPHGSVAEQQERDTAAQQSWQDVFTWADGEIRERKELGFDGWQGIPLSVLRDASPKQIQNFLRKHTHYFPRFRGSHGPEVWNTVTWYLDIKKLKTIEWSIARLALELMSHVPESQHWTLPENPEVTEDVLAQLSIASTSEVHSSLDHIQDKLNTLAGKRKNNIYYYHFDSPAFPRYCANQPYDLSSTDQLNANLHSLFESPSRQSGGVISLLPSICFYLLTSNAPPSIHTYNLLISEFAGERQDHLIRYLLTSLYRTHMRPNEITLAETLRHFVRTCDRDRFDRHVIRMEGFDQGLGEAHPRLDFPELLKFQYRLRVTRGSVNGEVTNEYHEYSDLSNSDILAMKKDGRVKVYEKSRRNLDVYRALIQGALYFSGLSGGMKHYRSMISDGWQPDEEILLSILHRCVVDGEWDAGVATWRQLQTRHISIPEHGYLLMLQLCRQCKKQELIQEVLQSGVLQRVLPPTVLELGWDERTVSEQAQNPMEELNMAKHIWSLEQTLENFLQESREQCEVSQKVLKQIDLATNEVKNSMRQPSLKTIALLNEARILPVGKDEYLNEDTFLRHSDERILNLAKELNDILLFRRVRELEALLQNRCSAITHCVEDCGSILLSLYARMLDNFVNKTLTSTVQFIKQGKTQVLQTHTRILKGRFDAIHAQTPLIRNEIAPFVTSLLPACVQHLRSWVGNMKADLRTISAELDEVLTVIHSGAYSLEKSGNLQLHWQRCIKPKLESLAARNPKPPPFGAFFRLKFPAERKRAPARLLDKAKTCKRETVLPQHQDQAETLPKDKQTSDLPSAPRPRPINISLSRNHEPASEFHHGWRKPPPKIDLGHGGAHELLTHGLENG
ncbi:MAG: hypothetical protein Q9201_003899 [Fulgogasparrea decipioides]